MFDAHHSSPYSPMDHDHIDAHDSFDFPYYLEATEVPVENITNYTSGGFHPVKLGDSLGGGGRFRVIHKLGAGGCGTVWLCRDAISGELRAIKINAAELSHPEKNTDFKIAAELRHNTPQELLAAGVAVPSEFFWLNGPNGRHVCSVLPFLGPNLAGFSETYGHCPDLAKDICFRVALSMVIVHKYKICHGDFRPENIVFQLHPSVAKWTDEEVYKNFGTPETVNVIRHGGGDFDQGVPEYLVIPLDCPYNSGYCSSQTALVDFGVAYSVDSPPQTSGIPLAYAPPEDIFMSSRMGFKSDFWSLGCTLLKLRTGHLPFGQEDDVLQAVKEMEATMGPLPGIYREAWATDFDYGFANDPQDESLPVSTKAEQLKTRLEKQERYTGFKNALRAKLARPVLTTISAAMKAEIDSHGRGGPHSILPTHTSGEVHIRDHLRVPMDKQEADQLFDLVDTIFKWCPEDRTKMKGILFHPWFGDRMACLVRPNN